VTFANNYSSPEFFQANGITLSGTRFIYLSGNDRVVRAKKNKSGLHCMRTEKGQFDFILVNIYCTGVLVEGEPTITRFIL